MVKLRSNEYGKTRVRIMKVVRGETPHRVRDLTVDIKLGGDFTAAHTEGDNSNVVATDTMKNTVYVLGKQHPIDSIEGFAQHLARHLDLADVVQHGGQANAIRFLIAVAKLLRQRLRHRPRPAQVPAGRIVVRLGHGGQHHHRFGVGLLDIVCRRL